MEDEEKSVKGSEMEMSPKVNAWEDVEVRWSTAVLV